MVGRELYSELNLLVLSNNLPLKVVSSSPQTIVLSVPHMTAVNHSVMGISELGKHVPITPGIASLGVVLGRV